MTADEKDKLLFELRAAIEAVRFYRAKVKKLKSEMNRMAADADYADLCGKDKNGNEGTN